MSMPRYITLYLSRLQAAVADRKNRALFDGKRAEMDSKEFAAWRDTQRGFQCDSISEEDALNEGVPQGYRMVGREFAGLHDRDRRYLFERQEPCAGAQVGAVPPHSDCAPCQESFCEGGGE